MLQGIQTHELITQVKLPMAQADVKTFSKSVYNKKIARDDWVMILPTDKKQKEKIGRRKCNSIY